MSDVLNSDRLRHMEVKSVAFKEIADRGNIPFIVQYEQEKERQNGMDSVVDQLNLNKPSQHQIHVPEPIVPDPVITPQPAMEQEMVGSGEIQALADEVGKLTELLERERAENEDKIQQAYERGLSDGEHNREEAERRLTERYAYGLERLDLLGQTLQSVARQEALEIAIMVAKRILRVEIEAKPMLLIDEIKRAAQEVMGKKEVTIRLHPDDLAGIKLAEANLDSSFPAVAQISMAEDESLERGDCVIDTDVEQINLSLNEQLSALKKALEEEIK